MAAAAAAAAASKRIVRVHTDDSDDFLEVLGLNKTYKAVIITPSSTVSQLELEVVKALSKGMTEQQLGTLRLLSDGFAVFFQPTAKHARRMLSVLDKPLAVLMQNEREHPGHEGKFWWAKLPEETKPKRFRRSSSPSKPAARKAARYFGNSLLRQYEAGEPRLLTAVTAAIRRHGLDSEGIFRLSANVGDVLDYQEQFEDNKEPEIRDEHLAAALLKSWLRQLPEPVFPFNHYRVISAVSHVDDAARFELLASLLVGTLPAPNRACLATVLQLVADVIAHADANKMTAENLAICLAPNLCRPAHQDDQSLMNDSALIAKFMTRLCDQAAYFAAVAQSPGRLCDAFAGFGSVLEPVIFLPIAAPPRPDDDQERALDILLLEAEQSTDQSTEQPTEQQPTGSANEAIVLQSGDMVVLVTTPPDERQIYETLVEGVRGRTEDAAQIRMLVDFEKLRQIGARPHSLAHAGDSPSCADTSSCLLPLPSINASLGSSDAAVMSPPQSPPPSPRGRSRSDKSGKSARSAKIAALREENAAMRRALLAMGDLLLAQSSNQPELAPLVDSLNQSLAALRV